jgi:Putative beta-barrel porin-2, OmpL-like. bbp2
MKISLCSAASFEPRHTVRPTGKIGFALVALAGLAVTCARGEIKLNDNFSVAGYAAGSYMYVAPSGAPSSDSFDLNAAKISFNTKFDPVTATFGVYYTQSSAGTNNLTLIDANVTYDAGGGLTVTGGRFLSWMGYEAFDAVNKSQVSSAYINPHGTIMFYPAYHEGVKVKYSTPEVTVGVALLDSLNGPSIYRGDGELKHNAGMEGFLSYTGVKDLTVWAGIGYDSAGAQPYQKHAVTISNVWVSYNFGPAVLAGEIIHQDAGTGSTGTDGLVLLEYTFSKELSTAFRISTGKLDSVAAMPGLEFTKFTVSPAYKLTEHLLIRPEISYLDYRHNAPVGHETVYALQAIFKF